MKRRDPITKWRSVTSQENLILSYSAAKILEFVKYLYVGGENFSVMRQLWDAENSWLLYARYVISSKFCNSEWHISRRMPVRYHEFYFSTAQT
jgi:hypothetical protein